MATTVDLLADDSGVASLTICDSPASMPLWLAAADELRGQLPEQVQATLRVVPNPPEVLDSFAQMEAEPTVYHTMNGPSEFHVVGTLKDWSVVDRLHGIGVPTLVVAGAHDEARPSVWQPFVERVPDAASHVLPDSSHLPHVEEPEAFTALVGAFRDHD